MSAQTPVNRSELGRIQTTNLIKNKLMQCIKLFRSSQ